jgi:hypothetical protein
MSEKVKVVPCSGIGKVFGLVARETALKVVGELCPDDTETVCLAYLVTGMMRRRKRSLEAIASPLTGAPRCAPPKM